MNRTKQNISHYMEVMSPRKSPLCMVEILPMLLLECPRKNQNRTWTLARHTLFTNTLQKIWIHYMLICTHIQNLSSNHIVRNFTESHSHINSYIAGETLLASSNMRTEEWGMTVTQGRQVYSESNQII